MVKFGEYAFNKSHSVAYTVLTADTAWLLYYFPQESMKAILNSFLNNSKKLEGYIAVTKKKGIKVLPPDINKSNASFTVDKDDIRFGLKGLRDVGSASNIIIKERNERGEFKSLKDYVLRMVRYQSWRSKAYESLVHSGSFDVFEGTRKDKVEALEDIKTNVVAKEKKLYENGQITLARFAENLGLNDISEKLDERSFDIMVSDKEYDFQELMKQEKKYAGFYITGHPLDDFNEELAKSNITEISFINDLAEENETENMDDSEDSESWEDNSKMTLNDSYVKVAGIIKGHEIKHTREKKEPMSIFEIEDTTGTIKVVAFPKKHAEYSHYIKDGAIVMIGGRVSVDDFGVQIQVQEITNLEKLNNHKTVRFLTLRGSTDLNRAKYQFIKAKEVVSKMKSGDGFVYFVYDGKIHILSDEVSIDYASLNELQLIVGEQNCKAKN